MLSAVADWQTAKTVLVADDAPLIRRLCSLILRKNGYSVVEATNGREAVAQYAEHRPDIVLLDLRMPDMDGHAALKEIKALDPRARVVIVTMGTEEEVARALRAGARGFVLKPFNGSHVLKAVETVLRATEDGPCSMHGWSRPPNDYGHLMSYG